MIKMYKPVASPFTVTTTPPAGGTLQSNITDKGFSFGVTNATTTSTGMSSIGATGFVFRPAAAASTPPQSASFGLTTPSTSADPARSLFGLSLAAPVTQTVTTATASAPLAFGSSVPPTASATTPTFGGGLFGQQPAASAAAPGSSPIFVIRVLFLACLVLLHFFYSYTSSSCMFLMMICSRGIWCSWRFRSASCCSYCFTICLRKAFDVQIR